MPPRLLSAVAAALLAAPAAAQDAPKPPVTLQTQPAGKLLDDAKAFVRVIAGPVADRAAKEFDEALRNGLGEKGFTGLDLLRPIAGYVILADKLDDVYGVTVFPVTGEDEFLDLIARVGKNKGVRATPVAGNKGLYRVAPAAKDKDDDAPVRLRFHQRHAYVGIGAPDAALDAKKLVPVADLVVPSDDATITYRGYVQRYPESLRKQAFDRLEALVEQANNGPVPDAGKKALRDLAGMARRVGEQVLAEGDVAAYRTRLDPETGEASVEFGLTARPGTKLAKDIAARKPTANRFAGLVTDRAAVGYLLQLPLFAPEIRSSVVAGLEEAKKVAVPAVPPPYQGLVAELLDGQARTVKTGEFDVAAALTGPDADGHFGLAVAVSYEDAAKLEKLLRKMHADAPEEIQNQVKLDHAKAGGVAIHRAPAGLFLPPNAKAVFGDKPAVCVAFAPHGVFLTFGPDAVGDIKAALAAKPAAARPLDVTVNPARLHRVIAAAQGEQAGAMFAQVLGTEDKPLSALFVSLDGGDELRVRLGLNVRLLPRAAGTVVVGRSENQKFQAVGQPIAPPVPAPAK